jgi:hypothetical protein
LAAARAGQQEAPVGRRFPGQHPSWRVYANGTNILFRGDGGRSQPMLQELVGIEIWRGSESGDSALQGERSQHPIRHTVPSGRCPRRFDQCVNRIPFRDDQQEERDRHAVHRC